MPKLITPNMTPSFLKKKKIFQLIRVNCVLRSTQKKNSNPFPHPFTSTHQAVEVSQGFHNVYQRAKQMQRSLANVLDIKETGPKKVVSKRILTVHCEQKFTLQKVLFVPSSIAQQQEIKLMWL